MTSRTNLRPWLPTYTTPPPPLCSTAAALSLAHTCHLSTASPLPSCFPWGAPPSLSSLSTFFSPALACPPGYDYEPSLTRTTPLSYPASAVAQDEWIDGETAVYCCPEGYSWSEVAGTCRLRYGGVVVNANCSAGGREETMTLSEIGDPVRVGAAAVQMRFQSSDGGFEGQRGTGVVATVVGGGDGVPAETERPGGLESDGGVLETGGEGAKETGRGGGTGGAGGVARGGKMGVVMVVFVVVGMVVL